jgi:signal transduction histidine kinase
MPLRYLLAGVWLLFTLSLTGWWFYFAQAQVGRLIELEHGAASDLVRYQKMLFWEGLTLFIVIATGGFALTYYMFREMRESRRIQEFLAAFTHEVKTPLSSVRLQAEILKERLGDSADSALLDRFLGETSRLSLQLDNSLFLANMRDRRWFIESIPVADLIAGLRHQFPDLAIAVRGEAEVRADKRVLDCILGNICQNAIVHGRAKTLTVGVERSRGEGVVLTLCDDGAGFSGEKRSLAAPFVRHYGGSGTGIGLFLVRHLAREMGGSARFPECGSGFCVELSLKSAGEPALTGAGSRIVSDGGAV